MISMKKIFVAGFAAASVLIASCSQTKDKKQLITGKWQAISLENPKLNELMKEQTNFLDTFGRNNTDAQNMEIYGFSNIDSARQILKQEMVDYMAMQEHAVKNTWFEFKKDGKVVMNFSGQIDTTTWHINEQGVLLLDETGDNGGEEKIKMEIVSLTDTMMKLQMSEQGMSSMVIFKPADK